MQKVVGVLFLGVFRERKGFCRLYELLGYYIILEYLPARFLRQPLYVFIIVRVRLICRRNYDTNKINSNQLFGNKTADTSFTFDTADRSSRVTQMSSVRKLLVFTDNGKRESVFVCKTCFP